MSVDDDQYVGIRTNLATCKHPPSEHITGNLGHDKVFIIIYKNPW